MMERAERLFSGGECCFRHMGLHLGAGAGAGEGSSLTTAMAFRGCNGIPVPPILIPARMWLIQGQHRTLWLTFPAALCSGTRSSWSPPPWSPVPCLVQKCSRSGRFNGRFWEDISYPFPPHPEGVNSAFPAFLASGTVWWAVLWRHLGGMVRRSHSILTRAVLAEVFVLRLPVSATALDGPVEWNSRKNLLRPFGRAFDTVLPACWIYSLEGCIKSGELLCGLDVSEVSWKRQGKTVWDLDLLLGPSGLRLDRRGSI